MSNAVRQPGTRQDRILALASKLAHIESELESLADGEIDAVVEPGSAALILLRTAREALARSETRFRNLVTRCPAIVCELDVDGTQHKLAAHHARELQVARTARHTAEAANLSKAQFLAVMSHELRTPLNAISGYAELIELGLRGPVTEAQIVDLQKIRRSKEHLLGLINDILSFARIEAGSMQLDVKEFLAEEVIDTVHSLAEVSAREKQITFEVPARPDNVQVVADRERTQQILINLVCNAIKFTPAHGRVALRCGTDDGVVTFEVHDTGVGIPADKLESVFEPFVQLQQEPLTRNDGMGLGLYISRSLAQAMGGTLSVVSRPGTGSVFTLMLPAAKTSP